MKLVPKNERGDGTIRRGFLSALALAAVVLLAGCAGGSSTTAPSNTPAVNASTSITGIAMAGPFPMQGATLTLYATQSNGYGGNGLSLASTTTANDGTFALSPTGYTCPAGQQAYITATGGVIGANTSNPNAIQMTAIGPCSSLEGGMYITINGATTVAAAYALDNFITVSGMTVNVSAPANNNAATGSCTGTGTAMKCVAAGLSHAFLNAATLVNGVGTSTAPPTGLANANPEQNPGSSNLVASLGTTANPYTLGNTIPVPVIHTLANILEDCVNSTGGVSGDGSNCGLLFLNATPGPTYSASSAAPTNTLQAMMNIAHFPFVNVTALYALATANNYYQPALTAAPVDFSVSIIYRSLNTVAGPTSIGEPFNVALDANDNVFVSANSPGTSPSGSGALPVLVSQFSSNGSSNWQTSLTNSTLCATGLTGNLCNLAVDASGNSYLTDVGYLYQLNSSGSATPLTLALNGTTTLKPVNAAVDRFNALFVASNNTTGTANLAIYPAGATATTLPSAVTANGTSVLLAPIPGGLGFDSNGDLGVTPYGSSSMLSYFYPNTGTTSTVLGTGQKGTFATSTDTQMESVIFDANNNIYTANSTNLYMLPAGMYTGTGTLIAGSGGSQMRAGAIDGGGTVWIVDPTTGGGAIRSYYSTLATPVFGSITGCVPWGASTGTASATSTVTTSTASTICNPAIWNGSNLIQRPARGSRNVAIDSTGSIWVNGGGNFAIAQVIGSALPTWPLLSYSKFGIVPQ
jgi:hypothetical protein